MTVESARGARLRDVDGNELIDYLMGFGVGLFGHNPAFIVDAVRAELERGIHIGTHDHHAGEVAQLVRELTGMERVFFCNSGTEAVMSALRIARAATGRSRVVAFAGSYHGHSDATLVRAHDDARGVPRYLGVSAATASEIVVLPYGGPQCLELLEREGDSIAAVLVEPVQRANVSLQPKEFLHELRAVTSRRGVQLVFDEVLTGFRLHPGGAQAWFGVTADLATYGKVVGGGMPIGLVAGRADLMNFVDGGAWRDDDESGPRSFTTFVAGTFSKHPLATAAAVATLRQLRVDGEEICRRLNDRTAALLARLNDSLASRSWPLRAVGCGSMFSIEGEGVPFATGPGGPADVLHFQLLLRGVYTSGLGPTYVTSTEHGEPELTAFHDAVVDSLGEMAAHSG